MKWGCRRLLRRVAVCQRICGVFKLMGDTAFATAARSIACDVGMGRCVCVMVVALESRVATGA